MVSMCERGGAVTWCARAWGAHYGDSSVDRVLTALSW